jgi:SAM-dependent methyltransferase
MTCWVCGSTETYPWKSRSLDRPLQPCDLQITDSNYGCTLALRRCRRCAFVFADAAELGELSSLYQRLVDDAYEAGEDPRSLQMGWLLDAAGAAHPQIRTALDVGAGTGLLVKLARQRGWNAEGVEPSRQLVECAWNQNRVRLLLGTIPHRDVNGRKFDAVFLVDVIEHVADPIGLLRSAAQLMAPGGIMLVVTPDIRSWMARLLRQRWWHFRLAHVGYFDARTFSKASAQAGIRVVRRFRAKWFFRIAYLTERLARYLPVGWIHRLMRSTGPGRALGDRVIPLNLQDSWVFICKEGTDEPSE